MGMSAHLECCEVLLEGDFVPAERMDLSSSITFYSHSTADRAGERARIFCVVISPSISLALSVKKRRAEDDNDKSTVCGAALRWAGGS